MADGRQVLADILGHNGRNLFILTLGFEDRCLAMPRLLKNADRSKNRILCIEQDNANVAPVAVLQRRLLRDAITEFIGREFYDEDTAAAAVQDALRREPDTNIVLDTSTMPRRLIAHFLKAIGEYKADYRRSWLFDCQPKDYLSYVSGEQEIPDPAIPTVYDDPDIARQDRLSLVIFPGFNCFETAAILARVINPTRRNQVVGLRWVFCHPGAKYEFYERAVIEHGAFRRYLGNRVQTQYHCLCRMDNALDIASQVVDGARDVLSSGTLIVANGGPRVLLGPIMLTVHALKRTISANVLITQPLSYRSVRSQGEGALHAWNLEEEYANIRNHVLSMLPS
jgi:hypothetical protein